MSSTADTYNSINDHCGEITSVFLLCWSGGCCAPDDGLQSASRRTRAPPSTPLPRDMAIYANFDAFVTKHLLLDLTGRLRIENPTRHAELQLERREPRATEIVLDTRDLKIQKTETDPALDRGSGTCFSTRSAHAGIRRRASSHCPRECRSRPRHLCVVLSRKGSSG